jgi:hypothetical protein
MSEGTVIFIVAVLAFITLALIFAFRFKSVRNTFEGLGFKISVEGSEERGKDNEGAGHISTVSPIASNTGGSATIRVGGKVEKSNLNATGASNSQVGIGKDVIDSEVHARGGHSAGVDVEGDAKDSSINAENPNK